MSTTTPTCDASATTAPGNKPARQQQAADLQNRNRHHVHNRPLDGNHNRPQHTTRPNLFAYKHVCRNDVGVSSVGFLFDFDLMRIRFRQDCLQECICMRFPCRTCVGCPVGSPLDVSGIKTRLLHVSTFYAGDGLHLRTRHRLQSLQFLSDCGHHMTTTDHVCRTIMTTERGHDHVCRMATIKSRKLDHGHD